MTDLSGLGRLSTKATARADEATRLRGLTTRFEALLEQAEGFARGGDYLGGQARARYAHEELSAGAASARVADVDIGELRRHLDLRLGHYDLLAGDWQRDNAARHTAYQLRERQAIGFDITQTSKPGTRRTRLATMCRRLWTAASTFWMTGAMRMGCAP
jgi:hypothetical protein